MLSSIDYLAATFTSYIITCWASMQFREPWSMMKL